MAMGFAEKLRFYHILIKVPQLRAEPRGLHLFLEWGGWVHWFWGFGEGLGVIAKKGSEEPRLLACNRPGSLASDSDLSVFCFRPRLTAVALVFREHGIRLL